MTTELKTACAALRNLGVALNDYDQAALDTLLDFVEAASDPIAVGVIEKCELDNPEYSRRLWQSIHDDWDAAQQEINETLMELQDAGVTPIPHLVAVKLCRAE